MLFRSAEYYALEGLALLTRSVDRIARIHNPALQPPSGGCVLKRAMDLKSPDGHLGARGVGLVGLPGALVGEGAALVGEGGGALGQRVRLAILARDREGDPAVDVVQAVVLDDVDRLQPGRLHVVLDKGLVPRVPVVELIIPTIIIKTIQLFLFIVPPNYSSQYSIRSERAKYPDVRSHSRQPSLRSPSRSRKSE